MEHYSLNKFHTNLFIYKHPTLPMEFSFGKINDIVNWIEFELDNVSYCSIRKSAIDSVAYDPNDVFYINNEESFKCMDRAESELVYHYLLNVL